MIKELKSMMCLVLIIICVSGYSRTTDNNVTVKKFKSSHNVVGKEIPLRTEILFPKTMLLLTDATIAVSDYRSEYALKILKTGKDSVYLAGKYGRTGQGPGDIVSSITSLQKDEHNSKNGVWVSDIQSMKFHPYKANSFIVEDNPSDVKKLSPQVFPCSRSFILKNSDILGFSTSTDNQVFICSHENNALQGYDFYPITPNPYDLFVSKMVYTSYLRLKPDKSHFVLAYQWLKSLCIVSLDKLSEPMYIKFDDAPFPKFNATDQQSNINRAKNLPLQYVNLYTTDNYIYALYADIKEGKLENHSQKALSKGMSVHVFKWDGTALCSLNLDRIINCFCVDEKNKVIYGIDPTGEDNSIFYSFDIPDFD
jgi:hypothetical protein